jgi:ketosteroid isomerase-like protein
VSTSTQAAESAITTLLQSYGALLRSYNKDLGSPTTCVEKVLALYTPDAVIMPPHFPPSVGQEGLRQAYTRIFTTVELEVEFDIDEIVVMGSGEWAFARTRARGTKTMLVSGVSEPAENQELFILRCEKDGEWKIARYAFSSMKALVQDGVRRSWKQASDAV